MSQRPPCFIKMLVPKLVPLLVSPALFFLCAFSMPLTHAVDPLILILGSSIETFSSGKRAKVPGNVP